MLAVTRGGSFSGSAVEMNTSIPGRSDRPLGLAGEGDSNFSLRACKSVALFIGLNFGRISRSHENENHNSHTTDIPHSHIASLLGFRTRHVRKKISTIRRMKISTLYKEKLNRLLTRTKETYSKHNRNKLLLHDFLLGE